MTALKLGALDVGTNTVLMLVAEVGPDGKPQALEEMGEITRLGRGVDRSGRLDPDSKEKSLNAISRFVDRARSLGAIKIVTAATSALRDASDGPDFVAETRRRTGVYLEVIPGDEEARLSYLAVSRGLEIPASAKLLIVDIGGGSTELIYAAPETPLEARSLQIGSVRLTERFVHSDPPSADELAAIAEAADDALHELKFAGRKPDRLVGIAGTVTTIAAVSIGLAHYDGAKVHGRELRAADIDEVLQRFVAVPLAERRKIPGLLEGRADVIIAGTAILKRIMNAFGQERLTVSDYGVRWGLIWREIERQNG